MVDVAFVVLTKNREAWLTDALSSIAAQTFAGGCEVVVVNNGGRDVAELVLSFADRISSIYIDLRDDFIEGHAREIGLARTSATYVGFLDDDDVILPWHCSELVACLAEGAEFAYGPALVADHRVDTSNLLDEKFVYAFDFGQLDPILNVANVLTINGPMVLGALARRVGVERDKRYFRQQDWDFWLRIVRGEGARVAFVPSVTSITHRIFGSNQTNQGGSSGASVIADFERSYAAMLAKWPSCSPAVEYARRMMTRAHKVATDAASCGEFLADFYYLRLLQLTDSKLPTWTHQDDWWPSMEAVMKGTTSQWDASPESLVQDLRDRLKSGATA